VIDVASMAIAHAATKCFVILFIKTSCYMK